MILTLNSLLTALAVVVVLLGVLAGASFLDLLKDQGRATR
jgi:hypothetical protein